MIALFKRQRLHELVGYAIRLGPEIEGAALRNALGIGYESAAGFRRRHFRLTELT